MAKKERGYNIVLKLNGKFVCGTTENSFKIAGEVEEILTKEDEGDASLEVLNNNAEGSISGLMMLVESGEEETHLDIVALRAAVLAGDAIPITYGKTGEVIAGELILTDYSESTNAKDVGSISVSFRVVPGTLEINPA